MVRVMARPVCFLGNEFDLWFQKTFGNPRHAGRKRGSGSYALDDEPLLIKMHSLITNGEVRTAHGAARKVAKDAIGDSKESSKKTRLAKRYRERFESEGN